MDGGAQRLTKCDVQDAGARIIGGRRDSRRDAVYDGDSLIWGGRYPVAGWIGDGASGDVQLRGGHTVDCLALGGRERDGHHCGCRIQSLADDGIKRQTARGLAGVPDV